MPSKQENVVQPAYSPVLFMNVDGQPMSFFLRPGPTKRKLQPLITAGGGILSNVQQPGVILLMDPEERSSIPESTSHWYVSIQYIHDCIEKNEQLDLEDYKLNPGVVQRSSPRLNRSKESSPRLSRGRLLYTPEEDAAILSHVSKHKTEVGGNRLWQQMEKQRVTSHSWQSMKSHYKVLAEKQSQVVNLETTEDNKATEEETEVENNQGTDAPKHPCEEDVVPPQTHSADLDFTQIDLQSLLDECKAENADAETSISAQEEEQQMNQQTDEPPAEGIQTETVEAETSNPPQNDWLCPDVQTDIQLITAENTERDGPQTTVSPQKQSLLEESQPSQPESTPKTTSSKKPKEKQKTSSSLEQPQRRITRRQLELEMSLSPEPYAKKLRSSLNSAEQPTSSPQCTKKTKSAVKSALRKDTTPNEPPSKKARGGSVEAAAESQPEQNGDAAVSGTAPADESDSVPQKAEKKKEKRKLGILELATKEFEDESESDEAPDLPPETEATSTEPSVPPPLDTAADPASPQSSPEPASSLQENVQEAHASSSNFVAETSCPKPAATEPAAVSEAVNAQFNAHLFIFDSESQEEDSQSIVGDRPAAASNPEPLVNKDTAFSLTQTQLEEDKQRIRELMNQTDQDLVSVTKALLKTSGDFTAALDLLLNPSSISGPFWNRCDDNLLLSTDPVVRQQLQEKYGEEEVAKRIVFLEVV
uniref:Telomeric repeat-binding factor 2-interacting protein 1 n=1 Tax=Acanthochromis polyacanthus TaxID=80966 RepID=A0A3Q1HEL2_9TELE